jgi:CheY-like chemotaxis protein
MATRKYKVLVVDDDRDIRELVASFLSSEGHICQQAEDGVDALDKMREDQFDALITDIRMPRMNGILLTREILKHNETFPVLLMTGFADDTTDESVLSADVSNFLRKPFKPIDLVDKFTRMMHNQESNNRREQDWHHVDCSSGCLSIIK